MRTVSINTDVDIKDFEFEDTIIRVKAILINDNKNPWYWRLSFL